MTSELKPRGAVPDVPELVRYILGTPAFHDVSCMMERENGKYVLYSQVAAIIAAKDKEIQELKEKLGVVSTERHADAEYIGHLQAELAKIKTQEPVGYVKPISMQGLNHGNSGAIIISTSHNNKYSAPLYAAPVDQTAEIERLREALKPFAEYMQDHGDKDNLGTPVPNERGVGWIYLNHGHFRDARTALSGKEPT